MLTLLYMKQRSGMLKAMITLSVLACSVSAQSNDNINEIGDIKELKMMVNVSERTTKGAITPGWFDLTEIKATVETGLKKNGIAIKSKNAKAPLFDFQVRLLPEQENPLQSPRYTYMVRLEVHKIVGEPRTKNNVALIWSKHAVGNDMKENLEKVTGKAAQEIMDAFLKDYGKNK